MLDLGWMTELHPLSVFVILLAALFVLGLYIAVSVAYWRSEWYPWNPPSQWRWPSQKRPTGDHD